jgi:hypothetical protein
VSKLNRARDGAQKPRFLQNRFAKEGGFCLCQLVQNSAQAGNCSGRCCRPAVVWLRKILPRPQGHGDSPLDVVGSSPDDLVCCDQLVTGSSICKNR